MRTIERNHPKFTGQFGRIVGNPPYNDSSKGNVKIYDQIMEMCFSKSEYVSLVIPSSCSVSDERNNDFIRSMILSSGLKKIKFLPDNTFPDANVKTMYFVSMPGATERSVFNEENKKQYSIGFTDKYFFNNVILVSIIKKLGTTNTTGSSFKFYQRWNSKTQTKKVKTVVMIGKDDIKFSETNLIDPHINAHKVITSFLKNSKNHLDVLWYVPPGVAVKDGYTLTYVSSENEGYNLISYLKSSLCKFIYESTKTSRSLRTPQLKFIPRIDITRSWTDQELYKHFNLTQDEINYIEKTIK